MALPLVLGIGAAVSGVIGLGICAHGGKKVKKANAAVKTAALLHEENISRLKTENEKAILSMDELGKKELEILSGFDELLKLCEGLGIEPRHDVTDKNGAKVKRYLPDELGKAAIGASILFGSVGGAALGTAGGIAAAGAATAAVMALGAASTGTAISALSGAAASNAALAAIGGGAIAAGGGGMALGSIILGGTSLGVGLLVGGIIFNIAGTKVRTNADSAWAQMRAAESTINALCGHFAKLAGLAGEYHASLCAVQSVYASQTEALRSGKTAVQKAVDTASLLYDMCAVRLLIPSEDKNELDKINEDEVRGAMERAKQFVMSN